MKEIWLSISDYTEYRNVSVSTVRRYIKSKSVLFKKENGKYYIHVDIEKYEKKKNNSNKLLSLKIQNEDLTNRLLECQEKLEDLETLVAVYESKYERNVCLDIQLPDIPTI